MSIFDDVRDELDAATVVITAMSGRDVTGAPIYSGASVNYTPHFDLKKTRRITLPNGDVVNSAGSVYVAGSPPVDPTSRLALKDGSKRKILVVEAFPDEPAYGVGVQVVVYQ